MIEIRYASHLLQKQGLYAPTSVAFFRGFPWGSYDDWLNRNVRTEDKDVLAKLHRTCRFHGQVLPPLPATLDKLTNAQMTVWALLADAALNEHYMARCQAVING